MKPVAVKSIPALMLAAALGGCAGFDPAPPHDWLLLPAAGAVAVGNGYTGLPYIAGTVAAYALFDPLAPNWTIQEFRQGDDRYRLALRMKALHTGGDGEARQVFARRAGQLAGQPGWGAYEVIQWQEGLESTRPFSQRVAFGEIRLVRLDPPSPISRAP